MPNNYKTTDLIVAQRLEDGKNEILTLKEMCLFASGAFSNVYRGTATTESDRQVEIVIKKTWPRNKEAPMEVKILGILGKQKHKNIARLLYSFQKQHEDRICLSLIFELVPTNLYHFLKSHNRNIDIVEVKLITWQLFRGQAHLQKSNVCHRDIKPQNLLYDPSSGLLKISDFGSSSIELPKTAQQSYHVTRYYRPPELLLGSQNYGCEIDIWSCGCVFGELLKGGIFLAGKSATNQAEVVFDALGTPNGDDVKAMKVKTAKYKEICHSYQPDESNKTMNFTYLYNQTTINRSDRRSTVFNEKIDRNDMKESARIIRSILTYNPKNRLNGIELLSNQYFSQLFDVTTVRFNNQPIGCLTRADLKQVENGDRTTTQDTMESMLKE